MPTFNDIPSVLEDFCAWASEKGLRFHPAGETDTEVCDQDRVIEYLQERGPVILNHESPFFRDKVTGEPCERRGSVLCHSTTPGHLHVAIDYGNGPGQPPRPRAHPSPLTQGAVPYEQPVFAPLPEPDRLKVGDKVVLDDGTSATVVKEIPTDDEDPHADFLDAGNPQGHLR